MSIHIFYHSRDLDGHCSGAIAKYFHMRTGAGQHQIKMWPYDYGDIFPFDEIKKNENVWMVDVTTQPYETMLEIREKYLLFVIDHHKSFIEFQAKNKMDGVFEIGKSACELTWKHCFPNFAIPKLVYLLGRYDVWDNADEELWETQILTTQMGIKSQNTDPSTNFSFWEDYFNSHLNGDSAEQENQINRDGSIILEYQKAEDDKTVKLFSFPAKFKNYNVLCLNSTRFNSMVFKSKWDPKKYDFMLGWTSVKGKHFTVSMYTDKPGIDVSVIAKSLGGGGHVRAAGFTCKNVGILVDSNDEKQIIIT